MPGHYGKGAGMKPKGSAMSAMKKAREMEGGSSFMAAHRKAQKSVGK